MKQLFEELQHQLEAGREAALATIIASSGSTPRGAGSRMLVREDGTTLGTVGGGAVEYRAICEAMEVMKEKTSRSKAFTLTRSQVADIGMVCGGNVVVYLQYIPSGDEGMKALAGRFLSALDRDEDSWLVLDLTQEACWSMGLYTDREGLTGMEAQGLLKCPDAFGLKAVQKEIDGHRYYVEPLVQAGRVYVFGGGHVSQELVPVLTRTGFRCVVMDDREEFANQKVFPDAVQTIVGDLEHISEYVHITERDYVCVMTRGHQFDYYVQRQALSLKPYYIGIMGSRSKIRVVTERLLQDGFSREEIEGCHMPIGLAIKAQTPAEIAVSIAAELIELRAKRLEQEAD